MFGEKLRELRTQKNMSQKDIGNMVGKTQQAVNFWENGESEPGIETLIKLAEYFGVTVDFLVGRSDDAVAEEGFLYGLTPEAKERVFRYAKYERNTQELPTDTRIGSSGLTDIDKEGKDLNPRRGKRKRA